MHWKALVQGASACWGCQHKTAGLFQVENFSFSSILGGRLNPEQKSLSFVLEYVQFTEFIQ
jgi:hypothetical protein